MVRIANCTPGLALIAPGPEPFVLRRSYTHPSTHPHAPALVLLPSPPALSHQSLLPSPPMPPPPSASPVPAPPGGPVATLILLLSTQRKDLRVVKATDDEKTDSVRCETHQVSVSLNLYEWTKHVAAGEMQRGAAAVAES